MEVTTIDRELERIGAQPSYIKVDVEGQDLAVLTGALNTMKSGCVRLVKFEHNPSEPLPPLLDLFDGLGWSVFALDRGLPTMDGAIVARSMNLFAAPPEVLRALTNRGRPNG